MSAMHVSILPSPKRNMSTNDIQLVKPKIAGKDPAQLNNPAAAANDNAFDKLMTTVKNK